MHMAMKRKLLVLATLVWVAPLSAHQGPAAARQHSPECPIERARLAAAAAAAARVKNPAPSVVVVQGTPATGSLLDVGRSSVFLP
jgi:hypothetical protein